MLLQKGGASVEVAVVELVRDAPPERPELSTLLEMTTNNIGTEGANQRVIRK